MLKVKVIIASFIFMGCAFSIKAQNKDFEYGKNLEIFFNAYNSAVLNYVDTINTDKSIKSAIKAVYSQLDPYTEYYDEEESKQFQVSVSGKYGGLGSIIRKHYSDSTATQIFEVYKDAPAYKAGLNMGDKIISINGTDVRNKPITDVSNLMKGDPGTTLEMVIAPTRDTTSRKTLHIKREQITINAVDYYTMLNDSVGYVSLLTFSENCSEEVKNALKKLESQGMKSVVLDLRANGGGILTEAVKLVSLFVPKGSEVVTVKGRIHENTEIYKTEQAPLFPNIPLAVLVNKGSASASEITSGAIQDLDRGVIIGQRTFGKGLVQSTMGVGYNSIIKITTAKYYIPSGRCIQALDYSHRNEDGSVGYVPDSLKSEFKTLKGRKVYDGGGILPDTVLAISKPDRFISFMYLTGYADDFACDYFARNTEVPDIKTFKLSDKEWANFKKSLETKKLNYTYESDKNLERLITSSKVEGLYEDMKPLISQLKAKIKSDNDKLLEKNREEIQELIECSIIKAYHLAIGALEYGITKDDELEIAASIVSDKNKYTEILR